MLLLIQGHTSVASRYPWSSEATLINIDRQYRWYTIQGKSEPTLQYGHGYTTCACWQSVCTSSGLASELASSACVLIL